MGISSYPDIISSEVTETGTDDQGRDYALVNLEFYNPNGYEITGLDVKGLTAEIQEGQGATETSYKVTVKLMEPTIFPFRLYRYPGLLPRGRFPDDQPVRLYKSIHSGQLL